MYVAFPLPDGTYYQIRELPWSVIGELERKYDTSWSVIVDMPQINGAILLELAEAVANINGLPSPKVETASDLAVISASLRLVDENGQPAVVEEPEAISWSG